MDHRSCQKTAPGRAPLHRLQSSLVWILHRLQLPSGYTHLLQRGLPRAPGRQPAQSSPWATRESALGPGTPPLLLHWPWCLQHCFCHIFLTPLSCCADFLSFLNCFPRGATSVACGVLWCIYFGAGWSWLWHGSPWPLVTETTPAASSLTTPGHGHSIHHLIECKIKENLKLERNSGGV